MKSARQNMPSQTVEFTKPRIVGAGPEVEMSTSDSRRGLRESAISSVRLPRFESENGHADLVCLPRQFELASEYLRFDPAIVLSSRLKLGWSAAKDIE